MDTRLPRRRLLFGAATLGALTFSARLGSAARVAIGPALGRADELGDGNLVLLQLSGGNDGLSMVAPFGDDAYHAARRTLAFGRDEVLALDDYRGLNRELAGLHAAYQEGQLAIVEGCGYPNPNRSHFKSMEIWHTADARGKDSGDGWIGRLCEAAWKRSTHANRVVHVGGDKPYSVSSRVHPCASFVFPAGYRWVGNEASMTDAVEGYPDQPAKGGTLDDLRGLYNDARDSSLEVRTAVGRYRPRSDYPDTGLGRAMLTVAALIQGDIGSRVLSVTLGGFDTHNTQRSRHDNLMAELDGALAAFRKDLAGTARGDATTLLAFSEFGRRLAENGSKGTDHGVAGPMLVMGAGVRGGLYGAHPSLTELDKGDLVHTTDFRAVYGEVARGTFGIEPERFLDKDYGRVGFLES